MENVRTFTSVLVGFVLGFVASNLLVVASMENGRLRTELDSLHEQVSTMRGAADAREARVQEIIASVDEYLDNAS
jgi:hypothetical protein